MAPGASTALRIPETFMVAIYNMDFTHFVTLTSRQTSRGTATIMIAPYGLGSFCTIEFPLIHVLATSSGAVYVAVEFSYSKGGKVHLYKC